MDEIIVNLEKKIDTLFTQEEFVHLKNYSKNNPIYNDNDFILPESKVLTLFFGINAHNFGPEERPPLLAVYDINTTVILDGMYPLHLAVFSPCTDLISALIQHYGADPSVKCCDPNSPFYDMTPLELALHLVTKFISWTPGLPLLDLISMFHYNNIAKLLFRHIRVLVSKSVSVGVRDLIYKRSHELKYIELAALLLAASPFDDSLSTMYFATTTMPPELHFGLPLMLRQLLASRISLLLTEEIYFKLTAAHHSDEAYATHKSKMMALTTVMKLLESADRGDLVLAFYRETWPTVDKNYQNDKDKGDNTDCNNNVTKGSQDETWVNRYLNTSLMYTNPKLFRPCGYFDLLMPCDFPEYFLFCDGIDISNGGAAAELVFRELNGRKFEELSFQDSCIFRYHLGATLRAKFQETNKLQSVAAICNWKHNVQASRTLHTAANLTSSLPICSSTRSSQLIGSGRKMSSIVNEDDDHDLDRVVCCCPDSKQKKCIEDWSSFPPEELNLIREIIENDKAAEFKSFLEKLEINYVRGDVLITYAGCKVCPYNILGKICHYRAFSCANELFSHQVGKMINLNIPNCHGSYPLHDAAITLSSSLVKLLLEHGATPKTPVPGQKISSLDFALERLSCDRNLINWNPKKSVFKLIITLCLQQMARETIALLAGSVTTINIPNDAIFNAVKRGQVVAVAALLLVAREKVLREVCFHGWNVSSVPLTFRRAIMNELAAIINQEYALLGREEVGEIWHLCLEKKELLLYFLQMLVIFEKAGPELDLYLKSFGDKTEHVPDEEVSCDVAELLENAGFTLSQSDYLDSSLTPEPVPSDIEMEEQGDDDDSDDIWFRPARKQLCLCDVKNASCSTSKVFHRLVGQSFIHGQHRGFSSHAGPSAYHHSWTIPPKILKRVEPLDKFRNTVKEESSKWVSRRVVRSVSVLLAALKRSGARGV